MATDFGTDLDCGEDLSPTLGLVSGRRALAQAILRRLTTARGTLERHPTYGLDLRGWLSETLDASALLRLQQGIQAQCLEDERVLRAAVSVDGRQPRKLVVRLTLTTAEGPFRLVIGASQLTVDLLEAT